MNNGARLFAYATWAVMISLAIIVFTGRFLGYLNDPGWIGLVALLAFGFIYINFSYYVSKRYTRKSFDTIPSHYLLAVLIFLPPTAWILLVDDQLGRYTLVPIAVVAIAAGLGCYYGERSGKLDKVVYLEKLQEMQNRNS
ncbi:MAG: hypothetical protein WDZ29_03185 [Balneolaceae bacterium]